MQKIIFIFLLFGQSLLGQVKTGTYKVVSDSLTKSIELIIREDQTFTYKNRNHISCFAWYELNGTWKINFDKLILVDFAKAYDKDLKNSIPLRRTTIYRVSKNNLIFHSQYDDKSKPEFIYSRNLFGNFALTE